MCPISASPHLSCGPPVTNDTMVQPVSKAVCWSLLWIFLFDFVFFFGEFVLKHCCVHYVSIRNICTKQNWWGEEVRLEREREGRLGRMEGKVYRFWRIEIFKGFFEKKLFSDTLKIWKIKKKNLKTLEIFLIFLIFLVLHSIFSRVKNEVHIKTIFLIFWIEKNFENSKKIFWILLYFSHFFLQFLTCKKSNLKFFFSFFIENFFYKKKIINT